MGRLGARLWLTTSSASPKAGGATLPRSGDAAKGYQAKRQFAMALALDREGLFLKVKEKEALRHVRTKASTHGWLHIWEVADLEKYPYDPSNESSMALLTKFVEGCATRLSEKPSLASDGILRYDYSKRMLDLEQKQHSKGYEITGSREIDGTDFDQASAGIEKDFEGTPTLRKAKKIKDENGCASGSSGPGNVKMEIDRDVKDKNEFLKAVRQTKTKLNKQIEDWKVAQTKWDDAMKKGQLEHANPALLEKVSHDAKALDEAKTKIIGLEVTMQSMAPVEALKLKDEKVIEEAQGVLSRFLAGSWSSMKKALSSIG